MHPTIRSIIARLFTASTLVILGGIAVAGSILAIDNRANLPIIYQGRLMNSSYIPLDDAARSVQFAIYDSPTSGTCVWATGPADGTTNCATPGALTVSVERGNFSVTLGNGGTNNPTIPTSFNAGAHYLQVHVFNGTSYETLSPRRQLSASPYAYNADLLDGLDATDFLLTAGLSGGQTISGGVATSENLILTSTTDTTKGKILFGASVYDETSNRLGLNTTAPRAELDIAGNIRTTNKAGTLTGSIDTTASTAIVGVGTLFTTELLVGDRITIDTAAPQTRTITAIIDDTHLTVDTAFADNPNDTSVDILYALATMRDSNGTVKFRITDNGSLAIGGAVIPPSGNTVTLLELWNSDTANNASINMRTPSNGAFYKGQRSNGTLTSPTATVNTNQLVGLQGAGYTGSAWTNANGTVDVLAEGTFSGSSNPTAVRIRTTAIGSTTSVEHLRVNNVGNVGIGTDIPSTKLDVKGTSIASSAETLARFSISDDALAALSIQNSSTADATFIGTLTGTGSSTNTALTILGQGVTDTGSQPIIALRGRIGDSTDVSTRPLLQIFNNATNRLQLNSNGSLIINGTGTGLNTAFIHTNSTNSTETGTQTSAQALIEILHQPTNDVTGNGAKYGLYSRSAGTSAGGATTWSAAKPSLIGIGANIFATGFGTAFSHVSAFRANNASITGSAAIANQYGLWVDELSGATNNYGIFVSGANNPSQFNGGIQEGINGTLIKERRIYTATIDPANVVASSTEEQTFNVPGVVVGDLITIEKPSHTPGIGIANARVSATDTIAITFINPTVSDVDAPSESYRIIGIRP